MYPWRYKLSQLHLSSINLLEAKDICCPVYIRAQRFFKSETKPRKLPPGPDLKDFIRESSFKNNNNYIDTSIAQEIPYLSGIRSYGFNRKVFVEVYGCQMNVNDTEIVWSILQTSGFIKAETMIEADVILLMTCAIRENAEIKIWNKLEHLKAMKIARSRTKKRLPLKIGILGCMAERLKHRLVEQEQAIDVVAGPDSYKDLPRLLTLTENNQTAINVLLSQDETYADVMPVRLNSDSMTAFVSIMRGCDNMCTYCIVPFTRGRERSRPLSSIINEVKELSRQGVREVTLLGQNVNSYRDTSEKLRNKEEVLMAPGFKTVYKTKRGGIRFAQLLDEVAGIDPQMRIRFTSPHPKDFPDEVLEVISSRPNVCLNLHIPAQSGSSTVLERMRRGYSRDAYLNLVNNIRSKLPGVTLSSDFICGFCGETDIEFEETISLMEEVRYNIAYLFAYSMREKTTAHRRYSDDVPDEVKKSRLKTMIDVYRRIAGEENKKFVGQEQIVLVEGKSKRSEDYLAGRTDGNIKIIIPNKEIPIAVDSPSTAFIKPGDYVFVQVTDSNSQVIKGLPLHHTTLPT